MREKFWKVRPASPGAFGLAQRMGLSTLQAQLLINRGISDKRSAKAFFSPRLKDLLNPFDLVDMDQAMDLIIEALDKKEPILVYGDYDVDGITASALLQEFFSMIGHPVSVLLPKRLEQGYGFHEEAIGEMERRGAGLVITVDCGSTNMPVIEKVQARGLNVVVTDHHQLPQPFVPVCPVVNPIRPDSRFPFRELAGVGVAFFLVVALRSALRSRGWFIGGREPDLKKLLDLVALGTVADMAPLEGQNRILVTHGIQMMVQDPRPGIRAIKKISGISKPAVTSTDISFRIAPRLNAPGRLGEADLALRLLTTQSHSIATDLALQLNEANNSRQMIERDILKEIDRDPELEASLFTKKGMVFVGKGWHPGVLGIVASRMVDRYYRPALVLGLHNGIVKGSARSIKGFNIHKALAGFGELFDRFGGHEGAAGVSLKGTNLGRLSEEFERAVNRNLSDKDLVQTLDIDSTVDLKDLSVGLVRALERFRPFGFGNPEPVFITRSVRVLHSQIVGKRHLRLKVGQDDVVMEAIGFGLSEMHPLSGRFIHMAYVPEMNYWKGVERLNLRLLDLKITST